DAQKIGSVMESPGFWCISPAWTAKVDAPSFAVASFRGKWGSIIAASAFGIDVKRAGTLSAQTRRAAQRWVPGSCPRTKQAAAPSHGGPTARKASEEESLPRRRSHGTPRME